MLAYTPDAQADLRLFAWYEKLVVSGDLKKQFDDPRLWSLSAFLFNFQEPTVLLYDVDKQGIWFAMWAQPSYRGTADVHMWAREEKRHTKDIVRATFLALSALLQQFHMLLSITTNDRFSQEHEKVGFVRLGAFPGPEGESDSYVTYLTRENFAAARNPVEEKERAHG